MTDNNQDSQDPKQPTGQIPQQPNQAQQEHQSPGQQPYQQNQQQPYYYQQPDGQSTGVQPQTPQKKSSKLKRWQKIALGIVIAIFVLAGISNCGKSDNTESEDTTTATTSTTETKAEKETTKEEVITTDPSEEKLKELIGMPLDKAMTEIDELSYTAAYYHDTSGLEYTKELDALTDQLSDWEITKCYNIDSSKKTVSFDIIYNEPEVPIEYKSALTTAEQYDDLMNMSKSGLYDQLLYEKFSKEAAQYAVDTIAADWNYNALMTAEDYQELMAMSPGSIYDQLIYEGFTKSEADYAIEHLSK